VRLPLQIGTSSLWSVARGAATLVPGVALVIAALPLVVVSFYATVFVGVVGALLVYFAVMHLYIAARSRPSDVILTPEGLRVEGGVHHGRAIAWPAIDPDRTSLSIEKERRYTLLRVLGNGLAVVLMMLARTRVFWVERREFDIARLRVALRDGSAVLLAEAERPIEKESLEALHEAIRSSGWHAPPGEKRPKRAAGARHTTLGISVLFCDRCGAVAIPDDRDAVPCRFCQNPVPIPPATRERVAASLRVREGRRTSDRLVGQLLRQPGARSTGTRLVAAAVVMMLAWPVAFSVGGVEIATGLHDALGLSSLLVFPVSIILGLFFLLRASLADRFALRLLTLDFGAQHLKKEGDPYTCRRCDAPLPDDPGAVVVGCRYCGADNIKGIDLRREAVDATREATSLEDALAKRAGERRLWGALTIVAVILVLLGVAALAKGASSMIDLGQDAAKPTAPKPASKPPPRPTKPAPRR
jgi:hypothetical protein